MKSVLKIALFMSVIVAISLTSCGKNQETAQAKQNLNQNLPAAYNFNLTSLEGEKLTLNDFKGKVLIIDFWDTWCPPCKAEIPHFVDLYNQYNSQGLEILGVAFAREGMQAVEQFIRNYGVTYKNAIGNQQIVSGFGGFNSIPTTFVIDQNGRIYKKYVGYNDKSVFENDIRTLLN